MMQAAALRNLDNRPASGGCTARVEGASLRLAPILDMKRDAGSLDDLKVFGVARHERQAEPDGDGGNQAIRKFDGRALLAGCRLDHGGLEIIGGGRRDLLVLLQPEQGFL